MPSNYFRVYHTDGSWVVAYFFACMVLYRLRYRNGPHRMESPSRSLPMTSPKPFASSPAAMAAGIAHDRLMDGHIADARRCALGKARLSGRYLAQHHALGAGFYGEDSWAMLRRTEARAFCERNAIALHVQAVRLLQALA